MRSRSGPRSAISVSIARWNTGQISGVSSRITKLTMPSLCEASATKPECRSMASACPVSVRHFGSMSPFTAMSIAARGLSVLQHRASAS